MTAGAGGAAWRNFSSSRRGGRHGTRPQRYRAARDGRQARRDLPQVIARPLHRPRPTASSATVSKPTWPPARPALDNLRVGVLGHGQGPAGDPRCPASTVTPPRNLRGLRRAAVGHATIAPGLPAYRRLAAGRAFVPHGGTNATNGRSANCSPSPAATPLLGHKRRTLGRPHRLRRRLTAGTNFSLVLVLLVQYLLT
jgi:hypothetical protein